jgi:hypothetical protein
MLSACLDETLILFKMLLGGHKKGTVFYYELLIGKGLEWVYV